MVDGISSTATSYAISTTQPATPGPSNKSVAAPQADTVQLSPAAQAIAMQHQGMQVKTIAANMGITTQTVDSYLGIRSGGSGGSGGGTSEIQSVAARTKVLGPSKT